jgi:hypothetical protein
MNRAAGQDLSTWRAESPRNGKIRFFLSNNTVRFIYKQLGISGCMLDINKVKGFLMAPTETFRASRGDSLSGAFRYYAVLLVIWTILAGIVWVTMSVWAFQDALVRIANMGFFGAMMSKALADFLGFVVSFNIFALYAFFLVSLVGVFFVGFFWHVFALLFGAKKELRQTLKATMYASTPFFLLGWIPYIAVIGWLWYLILLVLGISEMQEMTVGEAAMAVVVPIILALIGAILWGTVIATLMGGIVGIWT